MVTQVIKRDGQMVFCDGQKISNAMAKAARTVGEQIDTHALTQDVLKKIAAMDGDSIDVESIQDLVEQQLIHAGAAATAKSYILYREERRKVREGKILIDATSRLFHDYLDDKDWMIQENANTRKSINGMKGINTPGQALESGGFASFSVPRGGVFHLTFPALAREKNQHTVSFPLASLGDEQLHSGSLHPTLLAT